MLPKLPRSPAHVELDTPPPPAERLPLLDQATYCDGKFCKLNGRIIPQGIQRYQITIGSPSPFTGKGLGDGASEITLCRFCLNALHGDAPHLFSNNTMYANGFNYHSYDVTKI